MLTSLAPSPAKRHRRPTASPRSRVAGADGRRADPLRILAEALASDVTPGGWTEAAADGVRRWTRLAVGPHSEAWVIAWPPGGGLSLHDHGPSAGAVVVRSGTLLEASVVAGADGRLELATRRRGPGSPWTMAPGHVHDVVNDGAAVAVSVHVYAPRLSAMTHYRLEGGRLRPEPALGDEPGVRP